MGEWDNYWQNYGLKPGSSKTRMENIMNPFLKKMNKNSKVLDAGCGSGYFTGFFASKKVKVIGIDTSKKARDMTKRNLAKLKLKAKVENGNVLKLKYKKDSFDVIFTDGLLEHFKNPEKILEQFKRVIKKKGVIITFVPNKYSYWIFLKPFLMKDIHEDPFILKRLVKLHEKVGLKVVQKGGLNVLPFRCSPEFLGPLIGRILYVIARKR
ncbi:MAG: class I SAM-dependent methyltransferase [archaeon]|nr:MAG: class I SAM-dependent methyltransferase [archaeon]